MHWRVVATESQTKKKFQESPWQTKPKKGQFMNFSEGRSGTKVRCESCLFSQGKTPNSQKWAKFMNFSFWPFLWFAGATPESCESLQIYSLATLTSVNGLAPHMARVSFSLPKFLAHRRLRHKSIAIANATA